MAVFHETGGSDEGLKLFDAWSSKGSKYQGSSNIESKWKSLNLDIENPITIGTLIAMVKQEGIDAQEVLQQAEPQFEPCETVTIKPDEKTSGDSNTAPNPLARYSLTGSALELEKKFSEEKAILGDLVLSGQSTVLYAAPNTGKTLVTLKMLIDSIRTNKIDPRKVFYLDMDDTGKGMVTKLKLAEEYGFHMLAPGYESFKASIFVETIDIMIRNKQAEGTIIFLDTLKKFVDLMNKTESSKFSETLRSFIMQGGTVISLAHTNKKKDGNRSMYAGTSDMVDDCDCAYVIDTVTEQTESGQKIIEFNNIKRRGNVPLSQAFSYDNNNATNYLERILSVEPYDSDNIGSLKKAEEKKSDSEIIEAIRSCINEGINTKMNLAIEAGKKAGCSRKAAINIIEKYTGDTENHCWNFTIKERGRQEFYLLSVVPS
jgi:hypothetical protein